MTYLEKLQALRDELESHLDIGTSLDYIRSSYGLCTFFNAEFKYDLKEWWVIELEKVERVNPNYATVMRSHESDGFYIYDRTFTATPCQMYGDELYEGVQGNMRLEVLNFILEKYNG
ncbi:hypothetical protein VPHK567_0245 [Vibrio phage K567]|nr:hypothetical protein MYOV011v1_p0379 [Vibrio phage 6E35.1a]